MTGMTVGADRASGWLAAAIIVIAIGALSGCVPKPIEIRPQPLPPAQEAQKATARSCAVTVAEIKDVRSDQQTMGNLGGRPLYVTDAAAWVRAGIAARRTPDPVRYGDSLAAHPDEPTLKIELIKAYIITITSVKSANVVLRVTRSQNGSEPQTQIYRGRDTGLNWAASDDEAQGALDAALSDALDRMETDMKMRCQLSHADEG
jgi:hypothetical protein